MSKLLNSSIPKDQKLVTLTLTTEGKTKFDAKCVSTTETMIPKKKFNGSAKEIHDAEQIYNILINLAEIGIKFRNHTDNDEEINAFNLNADTIFSNLSNHKMIDTPHSTDESKKIRLCNGLKGLRDLIISLKNTGLSDLFLNPIVNPNQGGGAKKRSSKKSSKKNSKKSSSKKSRSKK